MSLCAGEILGTGNNASTLVRDLQLLPNARVIAVGSRSPVSADDLGERLGIPCRYGSYEQPADDPEIDAVLWPRRIPFTMSAAEWHWRQASPRHARKSFPSRRRRSLTWCPLPVPVASS